MADFPAVVVVSQEVLGEILLYLRPPQDIPCICAVVAPGLLTVQNASRRLRAKVTCTLHHVRKEWYCGHGIVAIVSGQGIILKVER